MCRVWSGLRLEDRLFGSLVVLQRYLCIDSLFPDLVS